MLVFDKELLFADAEHMGLDLGIDDDFWTERHLQPAYYNKEAINEYRQMRRK